MSGNPITWKNVGSTVDAPTASFAGANNLMTGSMDALKGVLDEERQLQERNVKQFKENSKNEYLSMYENVTDVDELTRMRDEGVFRDARERLNVNMSDVQGMFGKRLDRMTQSEKAQHEHSEMIRQQRESPLINEHARILQTEGSEAANAFTRSIEGQIENPGALYELADAYFRQQTTFQNQQNAEARAQADAQRRRITFNNSQEDRNRTIESLEKRDTAFSILNNEFTGLQDYMAERDAVLEGQLAGVDVARTEDGEVDWNTLTEMDAEDGGDRVERLQRYLDSSVRTSLGEQENMTARSQRINQTLLDAGITDPRERKQYVDMFISGVEQMSQFSPFEQDLVNDRLAANEQNYNEQVDSLNEQYQEQLNSAYRVLGVREATGEAVDLLADFEGDQISNENAWTEFWGTSNIDQVKALQDIVMDARSGALKGHEGIIIPDFVLDAARQVALSARVGRGMTSSNASQAFRDRVDELMSRPDVREAIENTVGASRRLEEAKGDVGRQKLQRDAQVVGDMANRSKILNPREFNQ